MLLQFTRRMGYQKGSLNGDDASMNRVELPISVDVRFIMYCLWVKAGSFSFNVLFKIKGVSSEYPTNSMETRAKRIILKLLLIFQKYVYSKRYQQSKIFNKHTIQLIKQVNLIQIDELKLKLIINSYRLYKHIIINMKNFAVFMILVNVCAIGRGTYIYFNTVQFCIEQSLDTCKQWNTTVQMGYLAYFNSYMCFPSTTFVLGENGPIQMSDLKIGDYILGYDFQSGRNKFSKVTAWLHRDTWSKAEFNVIKTKQGNDYIASSGHNIAYSANGSINFKFADRFQQNDELISFQQNQVVQKSNDTVYKKGLFSPINSVSNFYIFPQVESVIKLNNSSLILVHSLSQIEKAHQNQGWVHNLLKISDIFGLNQHQNKENQQYLHPITHIMKYISVQHRNTRILIGEGDLSDFQIKQIHQGRLFRSSSNSNSKKQKQDGALAVFVNLLLNNFLITS